jgi:hypothetical protein
MNWPSRGRFDISATQSAMRSDAELMMQKRHEDPTYAHNSSYYKLTPYCGVGR